MRIPVRAFTLTELLVVISIISVLAGMLMPAITMVRAGAKSASCKSRIRQFGLAMTAYGNDNESFLPIDTNWFFQNSDPDNRWRTQMYWQTNGTYQQFLDLPPNVTLAAWYRLCRDPANSNVGPTSAFVSVSGKFTDYLANRYMVGRSNKSFSNPFSSMNLTGVAHQPNVLLLCCGANTDLGNAGSFYSTIQGSVIYGNAAGSSSQPWLKERHQNKTVNMLMVDLHVESRSKPMIGTYEGISADEANSDENVQLWSKVQ